MPNAQLPFDEQMALPGVRHSLSWREEEESAHVMPEGGLSPAADKDDNDDEAMAAICSSSNSALVKGFMVWLVGYCFLES